MVKIKRVSRLQFWRRGAYCPLTDTILIRDPAVLPHELQHSRDRPFYFAIYLWVILGILVLGDSLPRLLALVALPCSALWTWLELRADLALEKNRREVVRDAGEDEVP